MFSNSMIVDVIKIDEYVLMMILKISVKFMLCSIGLLNRKIESKVRSVVLDVSKVCDMVVLMVRLMILNNFSFLYLCVFL